MTIPTKNASIMKDLGRYDDYSWEPPARIPDRINLTTYAAAQRILKNKQEFNVMWNEGFGHMMGKGGLDFMLAGDTQFHAKQRDIMHKNLYRDEWHKHVKDFYQQITLQLLQQKSCKIAGINQVDLTRE
jgi:linoleate 10R-lipoxygenase